jgi:hypothetical protein
MKYALNLAEDKRILSACVVLPDANYDGMPIVKKLPEGNISDYRYIDGKYVYDPLPKPSNFSAAPRNITKGEYITVNGVLYKATVNIPVGERIITGQNAIETTIEEQLAELAKGE